MPGYSFSDSYMNDYGVVIASNECKSREDSPQLTQGGIGYWLRRIMAERAHSAREAVIIGSRMIMQYGYCSSGRTYCIADTREAWMLSVVNGKHWVACRVPDDKTAVIPNYYTIGEVDLSDTANCLASPDLIEYAVKRGWYDPSDNRPFSFRLAYSAPKPLAAVSNIARHWQGINLLSAHHYALNDTMPFAFRPKEKITKEDLFAVLSSHYENTGLDPGYAIHPDPHKNDTMRICSGRNQYGFVALLRDNMPVAVGAVMWLAPQHPCMQPFIPWYCGIQSVPAAYSDHDAGYALAHHYDTAREMMFPCGHAYCTFLDYARKINAAYSGNKGAINDYKNKRQLSIQQLQVKTEEKFMKIMPKDQKRALQILTDFTTGLALEEYERTRSLISP
jgi:dipeptidase